jgi:hypothetical protein
MKLLLTLLLAICNIHYCAAGFVDKEKKVLFIGNSLTANNDMPQTLQKMLEESGLHIYIAQLTVGGFELAQFAAYTENGGGEYRRCIKGEVPVGVKKILSEKWDLVVLQERGGSVLIPCFNEYSFKPSLLFLDSIIRSVKAKTVIYQGYAANEYPHYICEEPNRLFFDRLYPDTALATNMQPNCCSKHFENHTDEFQLLQAEYDKMARCTEAGLVRVGYAFEAFKKANKTIPLYGSDNFHPSRQGSYLIACLFYRYITKTSLAKVKYAAGLDAKEAAAIRGFADGVE